MCGIYGMNEICPPELLMKKLRLMKFRGPDYSGYKIFNDKSITLGHNRLAIIDLDIRSNQPMQRNGLWIVYNGEIYNFHEIKARLIKKGHEFTTLSDTEVILACYQEYGIDCPVHLNGMFSFVIYDSIKNIFFGARDRLGKKPFYYRLENEKFEFASIPSVLVLGDKKVCCNNEVLGKYLLWGKVPDPYSIYSGVMKLPAGHSFILNLANKEIVIQKYWDLTTDWTLFNGSYDEAKIQLDLLLTDAIRMRLIADVPIGVFLSGGIDSSLVAAIAQKVSPLPIHTFSIKFNEKEFDESTHAQNVAKKLGTIHTEIECSYNEALQLIYNIKEYFDEPFDDSSAIPSMLLAKYTRKEVTVALSGDGGDESFIGYTRYKNMLKKEMIFDLVPSIIRKGMAAFLGLIPQYRFKYFSEGFKAKDINEVYLKHFTGHLIDWHAYRENDVEYQNFLYNVNKPLLERISDFDIKNYLNNDINTKVDRATMAFSLESRAPLMDYRVVEFARSLPTQYKYQSGNQKRILKDILFNYLPPILFNRPKTGFGMPLGIWFRGILKEYVNDILCDRNLIDIPFLNVNVVKRYIKLHMNGSYDFSMLLWRLIQLIEWRKRIEM